MSDVTLDHFRRAASDIAANGDNDTLPFDIDTRFIKEKQHELAELANAYCQELAALSKKNVTDAINGLEVFSERLLVPTGAAGFRITTKVHPFWNIYLMDLGSRSPKRMSPAEASEFILTGT